METEIQLSALAEAGCQVQSASSHRRQGAPLPYHESLKIMRRSMLITLVLTTMAGLGAIKLRGLALQNDTVNSFLNRFTGGGSKESRAGRFEFMPRSALLGNPTHRIDPAGRPPLAWQGNLPPGPPRHFGKVAGPVEAGLQD